VNDPRHTRASPLMLEGAYPKVVGEWLGRSTVAITLDRYSHHLPGLQEEATQRVQTCHSPRPSR